jgi:apoptosis-inducing factor 2
MKKNIVVIGASFGGLMQAHCIMKHVLPRFPDYHLVLINPSPDLYFVISGPRAILDGKIVTDDQVFRPIAEGFKQYPSHSYTIIQGTVTNMDTSSRMVQYSSPAGDAKDVSYDVLIFASGGRTPSPLFTSSASTDETRQALHAFRNALPTAKRIILGGGGACAVEAAAEMAEFLNGPVGWFSSSPRKQSARITIVTRGQKLLPSLSQAASKRAEQYLRRLGVEIIYGKRIQETVPSNAGRTVETLSAKKEEPFQIHLDDGQILEADIYIPAFHGTPTTFYVPSNLLSPSNHVETNPLTLRVDEAGSGVYAIGEVSSCFKGGFLSLMKSTEVITTNLKRDLRAFENGRDKPTTGKDRAMDWDQPPSQFVPIGRTRGVGQLMGWWLPSIFIWFIKGRDYMVSKTGDSIYGTYVQKESVWKFE